MSNIPSSHVDIYMLHTQRGTEYRHTLIKSSIIAVYNNLYYAMIIDLLSFSINKAKKVIVQD